jgi:hypothetical protein
MVKSTILLVVWYNVHFRPNAFHKYHACPSCIEASQIDLLLALVVFIIVSIVRVVLCSLAVLSRVTLSIKLYTLSAILTEFLPCLEALTPIVMTSRRIYHTNALRVKQDSMIQAMSTPAFFPM